jgi:aryl-alcohol dehydrogenase-like predicted oxidoreductase
MQYRTLGRTGWSVSLLGLGTGGRSQLGQRYELPHSESARLVRHALDQGVNLIDTAPGYGDSETRLGQALGGVSRDTYFLSTKFQPHASKDDLYTAQDMRKSLEESLKRLETDYVDVFYLHGVAPEPYDAANERFLPELYKARDQGLIRAIGLSERYQSDHSHAMAKRAMSDGIYDVLMVGLNLMSPDAMRSVLPLAGQHNIGVVVMCAVRTVLVDPVQWRQYLATWEREGLLQRGLVDHDAPFDWLLDEQTPTVSAAAYKFAAAHPAAGSTLTGTANLNHFDENLQAILGPPLPTHRTERVMDIFGPVQRNVQPERIQMTRGDSGTARPGR